VPVCKGLVDGVDAFVADADGDEKVEEMCKGCNDVDESVGGAPAAASRFGRFGGG